MYVKVYTVCGSGYDLKTSAYSLSTWAYTFLIFLIVSVSADLIFCWEIIFETVYSYLMSHLGSILGSLISWACIVSSNSRV